MKKLFHPHPTLVRSFTLGLTYALILTMLIVAATPQQYDLKVGEVAPITITATKDVQDARATQALVDAAMKEVPPSYVINEAAHGQVMLTLDSAFSVLFSLRSEADGHVTSVLLTRAGRLLGNITVSEKELRALVECSDETLSALLSRARTLVHEELTANVTEGQEKAATERVRRELLDEDYGTALVNLVYKILNVNMRPTMLLDSAATEANRQRAAEAVDPVIYKQGQNIVRAGEVITAAQHEMLDSLGLLMNNRIDLALYVGLAVSLLLLLGAIFLFLFAFEYKFMRIFSNTTLLSCILVLVALLCLLCRYISPYLMPASLTALLVAVLLKPRIGFVVNLASTLIAVLMTATSAESSTFQLYIVLSTITSACICNSLQQKRQHRMMTLMCGCIIAVCNAMCALFVLFINDANMRSAIPAVFYAAGSGILSGIMCIGLQPLLEWTFNLSTQSKLLELTNPSQPLLRRLLLEAPGTYHHAIIVANLAEAGANAIKANGLLARVGAYYHDVGKLKRPLYFKENQGSDNPHDRTDPSVSAAILTVHPRDGVEMAKKYRIPQSILDIILQHHGDTPAMYFYAQAQKQNPSVNIDDFRYSGPRPQSAEAAIVMLADTVEAATRAAAYTDPVQTEQLIRKLIRSKMEDNQLSESPLTLQDLEKIGSAFMTVIAGVFHERIEYPAVEPVAPAVPAAPSGKETSRDAASKA